MNNRDLLKAIGDIDDKYLIEEYNFEKTEKNSKIKNNVKKVNFIEGVIIMNKKILSTAAIAVMAILIISVSIINNNLEKSPKSELVQIANPLTEVNSVEEMKKYLGFDVPTLNKEVESYIVIGEENYATHARIIYKDDTHFEMEKGKSDVSGIYGGTLEKEEEINNIKVQYYRYENIHYANWIKGDYSYSFQNLNGELNKEEIEILVNE